MDTSTPSLTLGKCIITRAVAEILTPWQQFQLFNKQRQHDWGNICEEDKKINDDAVYHGGRIVSRHEIDGEDVLVITEADRSATTILFIYEY